MFLRDDHGARHIGKVDHGADLAPVAVTVVVARAHPERVLLVHAWPHLPALRRAVVKLLPAGRRRAISVADYRTLEEVDESLCAKAASWFPVQSVLRVWLADEGWRARGRRNVLCG